MEKDLTRVYVYKDGSLHHDIYEGNLVDTGNNFNSIWMMKLSQGEEVYLKVISGKLYAGDAGSIWPVIFTGNLLKLDD